MTRKGMKDLMSMTILGLMSGVGNAHLFGEERVVKKDPDIEKERINRMNKIIRAKRGVKTFIIEDQEIEARNIKNAQRKFNNLKI